MTNFQPKPKPKRRYKRYSSEFKREALLRASDEGMTDKAVCDELGMLYHGLADLGVPVVCIESRQAYQGHCQINSVRSQL
ncbi:MAG: hypothetical protein WBN88_09765 [Anderseniella sp.]